MVHTVFIGLGSNLGNRASYLKQAIEALSPEYLLVQQSSIYQTPAWGYTDQPSFLNQVIETKTNLDPEPALKKLKWIENKLGRVKTFRYGPRCIDMDILLYDDLVYNSHTLQIPHPALTERLFVLVPLHEIAADLIHPEIKVKISDLLRKFNSDDLEKISKSRVKHAIL